MQKRMSDDTEYEINEEFKNVLRNLEDLEVFVEEEFVEINENTSKEVVDALLDAVQDFALKYDEFLTDIISIAGEVRGYSKTGEAILEQLEQIKKDAVEVSKELQELRGLIKEQANKNTIVKEIKEELVHRINEKITHIKNYLINQIEEDIETLENELKKMEKFYEETE